MGPHKSSELAQVWVLLLPYARRAFWFSIAGSLLMLAPTGFMLEVYDRVVNTRSNFTLLMLVMAVLGAIGVMELIGWSRAQIMHAAALAFDRKLGDRAFLAMFTAKLRRLPSGTTQVMSDLRILREFIESPVVLAVMEAPVALVFLVLIFAMSPVLGWVAVASALAQTVITWLNQRATQPTLTAANRSAFEAQQYAEGTLRNAQVIAAMGMQRDIHRRWADRQREFLALQTQASNCAGAYQAVTKFLQVTVASLLLGVGAWLMLYGQLNGGSVMMIVASILGGRVLAPLVQVVSQWRSVIMVRDAWERLDTLLEAVPPIPPSMPLPPPKGRVQAENVVAGPPGGGATILKGIAFTLQPGDALAVVGPSASGKTTLARLLVGLWPSTSGKVRLDGVDVFAWDKTELGPSIGYLPQDVELFEGTVAENIARFGEPDPTRTEAAARAVGLHEFILALPQGYENPVGREGAALSAGMRQRLGLARALYGDPVLVVLDEPDSSLDEAGHLALATAILARKALGTTFVVMTHRTSILSAVDKVLVLMDGVPQAFGPRDEVMAALAKAARDQQVRRKPRPHQRPLGGPTPDAA